MEINMFQAIILGIVQGLTEFLPISSTGHLTIVQRLFNINVENIVAFDVMLHLGTLVSIVIVFWQDIAKLVDAFFGAIGDLFKGRGFSSLSSTPYRKLIWMLVVATIPAVFASIAFDNIIEGMFSAENALMVVGVSLFITALLLYVADKNYKGGVNEQNIKYKNAFFVGIMQMLAITPGISRSGATIVGGLFSGFEKEFAIKFAFLMAIPAILGAAILSIKDLLNSSVSTADISVYAVGGVFAMVFGIIAIKLLDKLVKKGKLSYFSIYCIVAGIFAISLHFIK